MADIKTLLKDARKYIDDKNFEEAQECCKNILRKDKQNYLALVLLGKSLQDSDQAPLAFQKAIACKSDHPLAWIGLANFYEKHEDSIAKQKLFNIYSEILKLPLESDKGFEYIAKLGQLGKVLKNCETWAILLKFAGNNTDDKLKEAAKNQILNLLKSGMACKEEDIPIILCCIQDLYPSNPNEIELLSAKLIMTKQDFAKALEEVIKLDYFSSNPNIREWLCLFLCKKIVEENCTFKYEIESHIEKITRGIENTKHAGLLHGIIMYNKLQYLEAYKKIVQLVNYQEPDKTEAVLLIKCTMMLQKWSVTQKFALNFLTKTNDPAFTLQLKIFLFMSLFKQQKWKQAVDLKLPLESLSIEELASLAECYIQMNKTPDIIMENLKGTIFHKQLSALQLLSQTKYSDVVKLLEESSDDSISLFYLGRAYYELHNHEMCQLRLLQAAKLNPNHADTFMYLGHLYRYVIKNMEKSKKCYEKAHNLNYFNADIARNLSEVYSVLNQRENDFQLLTKVLEHCPDENWIYFRLGLHFLNKREWENAITHFRNVIKMNKDDSIAFECLADAYFSRGSYTSSMRAYEKVIALNPGRRTHCFTRIGYINSLLTQHKEAIDVFKRVLQKSPKSVLALKGMAETWIRVANKKMAAKLFGSARDCVQEAVNYITKCILIKNDYMCFWQLLADSLFFVTKLPSQYSYLNMSKTFKSSEDDVVTKNKIDIYPQAIACYSRIAKLQNVVATYDLASVYFDFYRESQNKTHLQIAFNLTLSCIKQKPSQFKNWNLLGKICLHVKKYHIAQHCFIKSLQVTRKWSSAKVWCNLGALYLKLKQYKISNYCFWRGQSTLPSYPQSWIGQALIAEAIREEEAMDLFRHAARLGYHRESALGYADWVCRTLKTKYNREDSDFKYVIESLYAIPCAIDLMEWFSCYEPDTANASTITGILRERFGLLQAAHASYEKALHLVTEDKKNIALLNMGRILVRLNKFDEAIKSYKAITEASLDSACGLALALYKKGLYEESYSAYDTALHWLSDEDVEKADLLVAMAGIMYMFKGPEDVKTLLFHSIQVAKKPTPYSLFGICALGLLHSEQSLSKLALSELRKYEKEPIYSSDIGFLKSYMLVCEETVEKGIKSLNETLHDHPGNALLWLYLAQYCLRSPEGREKTASRCAQRALCVSRDQRGPCHPGKTIATASIAEHLSGNRDKAFRLAKVGLHMYPLQAEIWAALLFFMMKKKVDPCKRDWMAASCRRLRRQPDAPQRLSHWAGFLEKEVCNI